MMCVDEFFVYSCLKLVGWLVLLDILMILFFLMCSIML